MFKKDSRLQHDMFDMPQICRLNKIFFRVYYHKRKASWLYIKCTFLLVPLQKAGFGFKNVRVSPFSHITVISMKSYK